MKRHIPKDQLLTQYEAMLDSHHKSLAIWKSPRPAALFATLAAFDTMIVPLTMGLLQEIPTPYTIQKIKSYHDSIIWAMRFFWNDKQDLNIAPVIDQSAIENAYELITHCESYSMLADFHAGYGRGLYDIDVDESVPNIRFVSRRQEGSMPEAGGILEDTPTSIGQIRDVTRHPRKIRDVVQAIRQVSHSWKNGCVVIEDFSQLRDTILHDAVLSMLPPHLPVLADTADLGGMLAFEFQAFWHALFKWSVVASGLFMQAVLEGKSQHEHLPTQITSQDHFVDVISGLTGLPEKTVYLCLQRLSFGHDCPSKPDIFLQPLLSSGGQVGWCPHVVQLSKYRRNILKLMARTPQLKATADNLIGGRELGLIGEFGTLLARHGYQFKQRLLLPEGRGEIDLLAFRTDRPAEVLVVEAKAVLEVDEINEVDQATKAMVAGQNQLRNAITFLREADLAVKQRIWRGVPWTTIESYFGVVLTPSAQPNSGYDHRELPAVTLETVKCYFESRDFRSPMRIWRTSCEKRWLDKYAEVVVEYVPIKIGEVTYEIPICHYGRNDSAADSGCGRRGASIPSQG